MAIDRIKSDANRDVVRSWAQGQNGGEPKGPRFYVRPAVGGHFPLPDDRVGLVVLGPPETMRTVKARISHLVKWELPFWAAAAEPQDVTERGEEE